MTAACGRKGNKFKFGEAWFRRYAKRHGFPMEIAHKIPTITPEYLWPEKVFKDAKQTVGEDVDQSDDTNDDDEWSNLNGQPQKCKSRWAQPPEDHKYTRLDAAPPQNHKKPREISWTMPSLKRNKKTGEIVWDLPSEHNKSDQVARSQQVNKKSQPQTNHSQSSASALKRKQDYVWTEPSEERKMSGDQERDDSNLGEKRVRFRSRGVVTPALPSFHRVPQIYDRHAKGPDVNSRRVHSSQALANNTGRATSPDFDDEQRASPVARLGGTTRKGDLTRTEPTLKPVEVLTKSVGASPVNSLVLSSERNDSNLGEKRVRFRSRGVVTPALPSFHRVPQIYDRHAKGPDVNTGAFANNTGRATPPSFGDEERLTAFSRVADVNNKEGTSGVGKERHPPSPRRFVSNNNSRSQIKSPKLNELQRTSPPSVRAPSPLKFISTQDQATDLIHQFKQTSERREMLVGASALMEISLSPISDLLHSSANNEEGSRFSPVDLTVNNSPNESDNNDGRDGDRAELDGSKESGQTDGDRVEPDGSKESGQTDGDRVEQLDGSKKSGQTDGDRVEQLDGSKKSGQTDGDRVEQLDGSKKSGQTDGDRVEQLDGSKKSGQTDGDRVEQIEQLDGSKESGVRTDADRVEPDGSKDSGHSDGDRVELDGCKKSGRTDGNRVEPDGSKESGQTDADRAELDGSKESGQTDGDRVEPDGSKESGRTDADRVEQLDGSKKSGQTDGDRVEQLDGSKESGRTDGDRVEQLDGSKKSGHSDGDRVEQLDGSKKSGQTDGDRVEQIEQLDGSKESGGRADADHVEPDGSKESGQTDGDRVELDGSKESGHSKLCRFQTADDFAQNGRHCRRDSYLYDLRDLHRSVPLIVVDLSSQDGITIYNSLERQYMATRQSFLHNRIVLLPLVPGDQQEKYHSAYAAGLGCKQAQPNEYGGNREQDATLDSFVDACIDSAIREIRKLSSPAVVQERIVRPLYEAPKNPSTLSTVLRLIREHISVPSEMYVFNAGADVPLKIVRGGLPGPDTILLVSCEDRDEAIWYTTIPNCCCSDGSFAEQCSQSHDSNMCHTTSGFIASRDDVQVNDHASSSNKRRQTQVNDHASSSNKRRQTTSSSASRDDVQVNNHGSSSNKKRKTTSSSASGGVRREGTENIQSIRSQIAPDEDYGMLYGEAIGCFKEAVNPTNPNNVEVLNAHLINPQRLVARAFVEVVTSTSECASLLVCIHDGDNQIQRRGGFARIVRASAIAAGLFDDWNEDEQCPNDPDGQDLIDNVVVFATNYTQEIGNGTKLLDHYRDFLHRTAIRSEDRQRWGSFSVTAESDIDGDNDIILLRDQYLAHLEMARRPDFEGDQFFMSLVGYYFRANTVFITCSPYSVEYYDHKGEELSTARRLVVICDTRSKLQFYTVIQVADLGCEDA
jgi:hypothetical protein